MLMQKSLFTSILKNKRIILSSKEITYGAIFSASSAALIILLLTFTPVAALPTIRLSFEGILVKLSGYLFGMTVGFISGNITEILIVLLRPTFVHWAYYLTIVLFGVLGGLIRWIRNRKSQSWPLLIALMLVSSIIFSAAASYLIIHNKGFIINFHNSSQYHISEGFALFILLASQLLILLILPFFYIILLYFFPRYFYLFEQIAPIYFLSILTGYFVTIPITSIGDSASYGQPYQLLVLVAIIIVPMNIVVNMIVIFFVWRILNRVILKSSAGKFSTINDNVWKSNYYNERIYKITKKSIFFSKLINYNIEKKIRLFEKKQRIKIFNNEVKIIAVTGTNGKSSVSKYISSFLSWNGVKNGLFISPHAKYINERISINGVQINNQSIEDLYQKIYPYAKLLYLSYFEFIFFMAVLYFKNNSLKYIIIEGGIGAKNDLCGYIKNKSSIITNVSLDHEEYLGNDIYSIAKNKSHIIQANTNVYINEKDPKICSIFSKYAKNVNSKIFNLNKVFSISSKYFYIDNKKFHRGFFSDYQIENIGLAMYFIYNYFTSDKDLYDIYNTIAKPTNTLPGRNEMVIYKNKNVYIDVCHNLKGIEQYINYLNKKVKISAIFLSLSNDKNLEKIYNYLKKLNIEILFFKNSSKRSINHENNFVTKHRLKLYYLSDFEKKISKYKNGVNIVVIGSFYWYNDIIKLLGNNK